MKLAQKHYRLLSIIKERGSVPSSVKPVVRKELSDMGLVEFHLGEEWMREKERYKLTPWGRKILDEYDLCLAENAFKSTCQGKSKSSKS
ncbi:hypothetical protein QU24_18480 [Pantoea rodasii]|uniref:ArnR1-like winged helix-turn-helix domain-containing protein n=1 Tax=Pantoea rodasii TaxID=1076549 RepID=A0A0B1R655_9GAMM|nr:hypothetical protein [Pantoea rodasii]KHJ66580.1 hypothetical protein QU24_18480 [Pantoea rodasii]